MDKLTFTVTEFCTDHNVSRTHFYALLKAGRGPAIMKLGMKTLVSKEAAAEWRAAVEAPFDPALAVGLKPWTTSKPASAALPIEAPPKRPRGRPRKVTAAAQSI